jgi:hypothetical protein
MLMYGMPTLSLSWFFRFCSLALLCGSAWCNCAQAIDCHVADVGLLHGLWSAPLTVAGAPGKRAFIVILHREVLACCRESGVLQRMCPALSLLPQKSGLRQCLLSLPSSF